MSDITLPHETTGEDQEILGRQKCPDCGNTNLKLKNVGQQVGQVVIRAECLQCHEDVRVIIPGRVLNPFSGQIT